MELDITNFLPKYPNIRQLEGEIFNPYEDDFYEAIYKKKEFYDERLPAIEEFPKNVGTPLKHQKLIARFFSSHTLYDELLLLHEMGCVAPETPILKWDGDICRADEIKEGDFLIGDDGTSRHVVNLIEGTSEMFKIEQHQAESYVVNGNHILTLKISGNFGITWTESIKTWTLRWFDKKVLKPRTKTKKCNNILKEEGYKFLSEFRGSIDNTIDITVRDYIGLSKTTKSYLKGFKCSGVQWANRHIKLDPYILGMWLGDGNSRGDGFTSADKDLIEIWKKWAEINDSTITCVKDSDIGYYIRNKYNGSSPFKEKLRVYDLINNKHIPSDYLVNDRQTRLELLAGIIDTDGYVYSNGNCIEIMQENVQLATEICYMVRSLGFSCQHKSRTKSCVYKGQKKEGIYQWLSISGKNLEDIPVKLPHKKLFVRKQVKDPLVTQITITSLGVGKYVGWELDIESNKRFLLGDFTVTHNTGKTCSAVGAIEQIRSEGGGFRGALYLAKGDALINNFINELIFKCTDGRYIPEGYDQLTNLEKTIRKKKAIRDYYALNTFETFAKEIRRTPDLELQKRYNNRIIIIDEVHNLRIQSKEKGLNIYAQFFRFLHVVRDCKILLMSGTPMKDGVNEIASVMNLIIPDGKSQLITGDKFVDEYFDKEKTGVFKVKSVKVDELKSVFKGRVSYLKAMQSDVKKVFMGVHSGDLKHFDVVDDYMSEFQSTAYDIAYNLDRDERKGVYSESRQASMFVYPDGSWGKTGYNKYIIKRTQMQKVVGDDGKKKATYSYSMSPSLRNALKGDNDDETLRNLEKHSSKYAASIRNILQARKDGKSVFLYNEFVQGSGLILFGAILELFGFSKASGSEPKNSEKSRYASLTNMTATTANQVKSLVDRFNQPDNMNGKIINVIMGSRKIAEGFSLQNVQVEEIQTPWFNYSETAQAIARGYRLGSHRVLKAAGFSPKVDIYQRVSMPVGKYPSIDLEMYEISEIKDISIKGVERLMKIAAWDCALGYLRNHVVGHDGQRECDYMDCDYECDGVPPELIDAEMKNSDLDFSTFQLYYASPNVRKIIEDMVLLFRDNFRMDLNTIIDYFPQYVSFELITALRTMIIESTQIINKYGFPSYMKEENNIFFLVDSLSVVGRFSSEYYTEFPHVKKSVIFSQVVQPLYIESLPGIVLEACSAATLDDIRKIMLRLPIEVHEYFIEGSILARKKGITRNEDTRDLILEYFENYYKDFEGVWVSWLLYDEQEILRCLVNDIWVNCGEEYVEKVEKSKRKIQVDLEKNPYGYYGQFNRATGEFCIRDVSDDIPNKKHKRTSGRRCGNWKKPDIIPIILDNLKIPIPDEKEMARNELIKWKKIYAMDRNTLLKEIMKKSVKNKWLKNRVDTKTELNELRRVLFWGTRQVKPLCEYLRNWFNKQGLLVEDQGCGVMGKTKI